MEVTEPSWFYQILFSAFVALVYLYINYKFDWCKYWSNRQVPHVRPVFLIGNVWKMGIFESPWSLIKKLYLDNAPHKIVGYWMFTKPALLVRDLEIIKRVLVKDFNIFRERGIEIDAELDPLAGHLFLLNGKRWRNLRVKLTPAFTSGKMKMMFPTMYNCGVELEKHLKIASERKEPVEVKDLMARFTTDVISSVAFGIETNSLHNPKSEFREFGKKIFNRTVRGGIVHMLIMAFPALAKNLKLRHFPKDVSDFFVNAVRETVEYREMNNTTRNDFLQLLIQLMRAGKLEDVDRTQVQDLTDEELVQKFSLNEAAAQCFLFFVAGFEASSSVLTFALYELALNPDIQAKLQDEIDATLKKHSGDMSYDDLCEMRYLDMVVQETFRKYPPVGNLQRKCGNYYDIPEMGVTINEGTTVIISVAGIHHDPKYYPNPEKFDPERFTPEKKASRDPFTYLPFGDGPRNCIGSRFALMQIKVCLAMVLRNFNVEVCDATPIPLVFDKKSHTLSCSTGVPLAFKIRK